MKISKDIIEKNRLYKIGRYILGSAPFALLLSLLLFWVEMYRSDKDGEEMINELKLIEQSLSTRYIGIFPDYLAQINDIFEDTKSNDSIIIFEDVLYYGLFYTPLEFKKMIANIVDLSNKGHDITIAYYGTDTWMFREVVQESRIKQEYLSKLKIDVRKIINELSITNPEMPGKDRFKIADSIASERYFAQTRNDDILDFKEKIALYTTPLYVSGDAPLFKQIDSIRTEALLKDVNEITFADFYNMYKEITFAIKNSLENNFNSKINFVELDDYLVMSCWSNSKKILFALPGKFAADEIGFISQDNSIQNYIKTQLHGVRFIDIVKLNNDD